MRRTIVKVDAASLSTVFSAPRALSRATDVLDDRGLGDAVGGLLLLGLAGCSASPNRARASRCRGGSERLVLVTGIMMFGLMRPERKLAGMGPDSLVVLLTYIVGVVLLTAVPG